MAIQLVTNEPLVIAIAVEAQRPQRLLALLVRRQLIRMSHMSMNRNSERSLWMGSFCDPNESKLGRKISSDMTPQHLCVLMAVMLSLSISKKNTKSLSLVEDLMRQPHLGVCSDVLEPSANSVHFIQGILAQEP